MDAVEFLREFERMCHGISCGECPCHLSATDDMPARCGFSVPSIDPTDVVPVVEQWGKDHPVKTRQSEFLKMFPNASIDQKGGSINLCKLITDYTETCRTSKMSCFECCRDYWSQEVEDV